MLLSRDELLGHASSDESGDDQGYDSEAAEVSKTTRIVATERAQKRRKLSHSSSDDAEQDDRRSADISQPKGVAINEDDDGEEPMAGVGHMGRELRKQAPEPIPNHQTAQSGAASKDRRQKKTGSRPGVIYLSSVPPHLRPTALRNLLEQRGFSPVTRLFLTPISKDASKRTSSTSKARRSYSEGWIEFSSHKTAKLCAEALNATLIGGKKGGYYRDDLWNMKYLRGMSWEELMEGVRGEKREEGARRDEERRQIQREAKIFLEGVEEGKRVEGIREKRKRKGQAGVDKGPKRTFRQFEAQKDKSGKVDGISEEAQEVLGKIF